MKIEYAKAFELWEESRDAAKDLDGQLKRLHSALKGLPDEHAERILAQTERIDTERRELRERQRAQQAAFEDQLAADKGALAAGLADLARSYEYDCTKLKEGFDETTRVREQADRIVFEQLDLDERQDAQQAEFDGQLVEECITLEDRDGDLQKRFALECKRMESRSARLPELFHKHLAKRPTPPRAPDPDAEEAPRADAT